MSRIGEKVTPPPEHDYSQNHLGGGPEVSARDKATHQNEPTAFKQIGPEDNPGMNAANPTKSVRSGDMKFSRFRGA